MGNNATFTCSATGIPPPTIRWFYGGIPVGEGEELVVQEVGSEITGTYTCIASNGVGDNNALAEATLTVFGKGFTSIKASNSNS